MMFKFAECDRLNSKIQALQLELSQLEEQKKPYEQLESEAQQAIALVASVYQKLQELGNNGLIDWQIAVNKAMGRETKIGLPPGDSEGNKKDELIEELKQAYIKGVAEGIAQYQESEAALQAETEMLRQENEVLKQNYLTLTDRIEEIQNTVIGSGISLIEDDVSSTQDALDTKGEKFHLPYKTEKLEVSDHYLMTKLLAVGDIVQVIEGEDVGKVGTVEMFYLGDPKVNILGELKTFKRDRLKWISTPEKIEGEENNFTPSPEMSARAFIESIKSGSKLTEAHWTEIAEACQNNQLGLREIVLSAKTKTQKKLIEKLPQLLQEYIEETGDRSPLDWVGESLKSKVILSEEDSACDPVLCD